MSEDQKAAVFDLVRSIVQHAAGAGSLAIASLDCDPTAAQLRDLQGRLSEIETIVHRLREQFPDPSRRQLRAV